MMNKSTKLSQLTNTLDLVIMESGDRIYDLETDNALGEADNVHLSISWKYALAEGKRCNSNKKIFSSNKFNFKNGYYVGMKDHFSRLN